MQSLSHTSIAFSPRKCSFKHTTNHDWNTIFCSRRCFVSRPLAPSKSHRHVEVDCERTCKLHTAIPMQTKTAHLATTLTHDKHQQHTANVAGVLSLRRLAIWQACLGNAFFPPWCRDLPTSGASTLGLAPDAPQHASNQTHHSTSQQGPHTRGHTSHRPPTR